MKKLPPEVKDEIFRLRLEERLSSVEIAERVGCTSPTYVCELLAKHPSPEAKLTPEERRQRRAKHFEGVRKRRADAGEIVGGAVWSKEDDAAIRKLYTHAPQERVLGALPERSWRAISRRASQLKVRRDGAANFKSQRTVDKVFKYLREVRQLRGLTQEAVADKIGTHKMSVLKWESGERTPTFFGFRAWLDALGCDIQVVKKGGMSIRRTVSWWPEEDALLTELSKQGASLAELATVLKRRPAAIQLRMEKIGLTESETMRNASGMMRARFGR